MFVWSIRPKLDRLVDDNSRFDALNDSPCNRWSNKVSGILGYILGKECNPRIGGHGALAVYIGLGIRSEFEILYLRGSL